MTIELQRVVITGTGLVTPLGCGVAANGYPLLEGRSGIRRLVAADPSAFAVGIAGQVLDFEPADYLERKDIRRTDRYAQLALAAAQMAVDGAQLPIPLTAPARVGVILGTAVGGIATLEDTQRAWLSGGARAVSPFFIPRMIPNMAAGLIALRFGCQGICYAPAGACASGALAIGEAFRLVRSGVLDVVLAGGAEAAITPLVVAGFASMGALSTSRQNEPRQPARNVDTARPRGVPGCCISTGTGGGYG